MIKIDLMIFDLDGTLVDSKKDIVNAVNHTLKKVRLREKPFDEIVSYIGTGVYDLVSKSIDRENQDLFENALCIFKDYYSRHSADETRPYPGVIETLGYFKDKTRIIVTNRNRDTAKLTLGLLGMDKYFKEIVGGDDKNCIKPMACPLNNILARFNVEKPRAVMIGDMDLDIIAGKNAGVYTCGVTYGIGRKEALEKAMPDYLIDDIKELKNIIR